LQIQFDPHDTYVIGIDTPLGLPEAVQWHVTKEALPRVVEKRASHNPYLYRKCEQHLAEKRFPSLSAIKDMIGSQSTKGIHFLRKLQLQTDANAVGVWKGKNVTAIEVYPATCKNSVKKGYVSRGSQSLQELFQNLGGPSLATEDEQDALYCALVAYRFAHHLDTLVQPTEGTPVSEGWIWYPIDAKGREYKKQTKRPRGQP
jgi:hypothetical protein